MTTATTSLAAVATFFLGRRVALPMEPFVRRVVAGGLALVAGLWLTVLLEPRGAGWLLGPLLVLAGVASLAAGIASRVEWPVGD